MGRASGQLLRLVCVVVFCLLASCGGGASGNTQQDDGSGSSSGGSGSGSGSGGSGGSGGGGDPDPPDTSPFYLATAAEAAAYQNLIEYTFPDLRDTMLARGLTPYDAAITYGDVTYEGYMNLVFAAATAANVLGDASLSVDLASGATTGEATNFMGTVLDDAGATQYVHYLGDVAISNGLLLEAADDAAYYRVEIDGTLENGVNTFGVNGQLDGYIFGDDGDALRVIGTKSFFDDDITLTVDGAEISDGSAGIWAEKQ